MTDESTYTADDPMIDETFNKQRSTENAAATRAATRAAALLPTARIPASHVMTNIFDCL
jgi:hypothetical protein